jgi:hypothetical protein
LLNAYEKTTGGWHLSIQDIAVKDNIIFAGTSAGVWRKPLSEATSIIPLNQQTITHQAGIRMSAAGSPCSGVMLNYTIQSRCFVTLGMYTISGKRVALLERGEKAPGEYGFRLDGDVLVEGLYVYHFQAGNYKETGRLTIVK